MGGKQHSVEMAFEGADYQMLFTSHARTVRSGRLVRCRSHLSQHSGDLRSLPLAAAGAAISRARTARPEAVWTRQTRPRRPPSQPSLRMPRQAPAESTRARQGFGTGTETRPTLNPLHGLVCPRRALLRCASRLGVR
jgi:hypothetical protein